MSLRKKSFFILTIRIHVLSKCCFKFPTYSLLEKLIFLHFYRYDFNSNLDHKYLVKPLIINSPPKKLTSTIQKHIRVQTVNNNLKFIVYTHKHNTIMLSNILSHKMSNFKIILKF